MIGLIVLNLGGLGANRNVSGKLVMKLAIIIVSERNFPVAVHREMPLFSPKNLLPKKLKHFRW